MVELIGWVAPQETSEIIPPRGPAFDPSMIERAAQIHQAAGFDRVLIGYHTDAADGFVVGAHVGAVTDRLGLLLAHRPGFVAPTLAARKMATLDLLTSGRLAVHIISGGTDADQARDGDYVPHDDRYRRSAEYVRVLRSTWASRLPFDHHGDFYRVDRAVSSVAPFNGTSVPVYGGGSSDAAITQLTPVIDSFMIWGEPLADATAFFARVRAAREPDQTPIGFSVSTRPILAATEGQAWDRAARILEQIVSRTGAKPAAVPQNEGSRRLLEAAKRSDRFDRCLWTPLATATGAQGNSTALVGTAETVAEALADYVAIGATSLLIRGYEPLADAEEYGRELIPRLRTLVADRTSAR
jgi:alkanesulfonate monooxygenase